MSSAFLLGAFATAAAGPDCSIIGETFLSVWSLSQGMTDFSGAEEYIWLDIGGRRFG